ncbi:MAG TPA: ATP-dependent DNA helicase RecG, partial [Myxococcaceae bacterium]|nr:ATP-dependent DNA helicase RecG [Myxococcaceae bacterium]
MNPSPASHPFSALLGPLRYACQDQFARLKTVKNLRQPIEAALKGAEARGAADGDVASLRRELANVDHSSLEQRREALRRIVQVLHRSGLPLPSELQTLMPVEPVAEPEAVEAEEAEKVGPTRLLSIAPSTGPLAVPLNKAGWRINPRLLSTLYRKGIQRIGDVLFLLPRCYEDRRKMLPIAQLRAGERGVTVGTVRTAGEFSFRGRRRLFKAVIADESGSSIAAVYFHAGPWLKGRFPVGKKIVLSGEVRVSNSGWEIAHPEVEPADDQGSSPVHFNRLVPIYSGLERYEQRSFRDLAYKIAERHGDALEEPLPADLRGKLGLVGISEAIRGIHFPAGTEDLARLNQHLSPAHRRLAFDELFFLQLGVLVRRQGVQKQPGIAFNVEPPRLAKACAALPFRLTQAQQRVIGEICRDMGRGEPMNRLLQGDVGSGKTAVATAAAAIALLDGYQVAIMAPTEILAEQHQRSLQGMLGPLGFKIELVTAGGPAKRKREIREAIAQGKVHLAVGTHALIEESVEFHRLGMVVIDEQHRFGVLQRHLLMTKGRRPDVLVMTATPIPRTLAMTLYGDLEVSVIDELPPGRTPIVTRVFSEKARVRVYEAIGKELSSGRQCYVVYPLVEESEKVDLADATRGVQRLQEIFKDYRVGLLHGRLKAEAKEAVMDEFRAGRVQILVCTTVVEVGVDVANA